MTHQYMEIKIEELEKRIKALEQEPKYCDRNICIQNEYNGIGCDEGKGDVLLADVIDWGQGYDDTIIELLQAFKNFRDGYYSLINYGDDWWKQFNQGRDFDEIMKEQWEKFESVDFMNLVEKMAVAIAGTYVRFDEFANGVVDAYNNGNGLRHEVEPQESEET